MPNPILLAGKHSCLGSFGPMPSEAPVQAEVPAQLDVPVMLVYAGDFETATTGKVSVKEEHLDRLVENHNGLIGRIKRMTGLEELPVRHLPPVQVDHSTSAWDTVGRVVGLLSKGAHKLENGETRGAAFGTFRILGRENVQRYLDGRWANVSVGADFEAGKLMESSIVPFPAAPDAAMLSGIEPEEKGPEMDEQMKAKLKKHLMSRKKMSDEDAEKQLAGMTTDEHTSMSAEADEAEKAELAAAGKKCPGCGVDGYDGTCPSCAEDEQKKLAAAKVAEAAKLAAAIPPAKVELSAEQKTKVKELAGAFRKTGVSAALEARKSGITVRLSKLQSDAKITPAEVKKIDVAKLSAASQETVDAVFKAYEDREPVILAGVFGTAKATNVAALAAELRGQKLMAETRESMPFTAKGTSEKAELSGPKRIDSLAAEKLTAGAEPMDTAAFEPVITLLDGGKAAEAKTELKKVVAKLSAGNYAGMAGMPKETEAQLSALAESVKSMQNQFDELMKLVGPVLGFDGSDL